MASYDNFMAMFHLTIFSSDDLGNDREKLTVANLTKMATYLFCQLVELLEADAAQVNANLYHCKGCGSNLC